MLNFTNVLIFSDNPKRLADFYQQVFQVKPGWSDGDYSGFKVGNGIIAIGPHDKVHGPNQNPDRILINFESDDVQADFDRIKTLNAKVIAEPYHPQEMSQSVIATFADPDGNLFQITSPMKDMM